jgi:hypothetical protein
MDDRASAPLPQDPVLQPPPDGPAWRQWYADWAGQVIEAAAQRARRSLAR